MKALLQRVKSGSVISNGELCGKISKGLVILLGVAATDTEEDLEYIVNKTINLRIFDDENGVMNLSVLETGGEALVVSQFTLLASTRKGRRPSYINAARPELAVPMYESFIEKLREAGIHIETGVFQTEMTVNIENDGPVTIMLDSSDRLLSRD